MIVILRSAKMLDNGLPRRISSASDPRNKGVGFRRRFINSNPIWKLRVLIITLSLQERIGCGGG